MVKKGQLLFKGDKRPKKKNRKKRKGLGDETVVEVDEDEGKRIKNKNLAHDLVGLKAPGIAVGPTIKDGSGRITTSGTVVTGLNTKFEKEISIGDAVLVIINLPDNEQMEELRVVTMRLSDCSLNLSSAFSQNIKKPQIFRYVSKPRNIEQEQRKEEQKRIEQAAETEKCAFDIYGKNLVYREKTETGSYRLKQQHTTTSRSTRGDLLDFRSRKTSDKYC